MNSHKPARSQKKIFSSPIRTLNADEIDLVSGGADREPQMRSFGKNPGGVDNHSRTLGDEA